MSYLSRSQLKTITNVSEVNERRKSLWNKQTVFLSHSHKDKDLVEQIVGFFLNVGTRVYVDWLDPQMPQTTCGETAKILKSRIVKCDKFVVLFTENSIDSKWIPWELGYADATKPNENIAIFPLKRHPNTADSYFSGLEYMELYPIIKEGVVKEIKEGVVKETTFCSIFANNVSKSGKKIVNWLDSSKVTF